MRLSEFVVKYPRFALPYFFCHGLPMASKYGKIKDNRMLKRYSIRRMRVDDLDRIMEIERASFGRDAYDRNLFAEYTRKCGELFLVAERGFDGSTAGKVWGYALTCLAVRRRGEDSGKLAELISVAVDPAARGTGAAKALMDSTLRRLRSRQVIRLGLMVKVTNQRARAFYERYGFKKVRIVRAYYEDGQDGCLMAKQL
jgi:ribosomal-protein-alanine N-acetyltransferase